MPEIPRSYAQANVPSIAFQAPSFAAQHELARAVDELARDQERQQLQTYDADIQGHIREGVMAARQEAAAISDPDQFEQTYQGRMQQLQDALEPSTGGDQRRANILHVRLNQQLMAEADNIANGTIARRKDASITNALKLEQIGRAKIIEDGADPVQTMKQYDAYIDTAPFLMADEKEKLKARFKDTISRDVLYEQARKDPINFAQRVESGEFKGLSPQFLDEALSIASRVTAGRDTREAKIDQARADAAERAFTAQAQAHQLNEAELQQAATWYKWDKDKVDKMLRLQYGIKMGSPYAEQLIADALAPVNKVAPTMDDVKQAEKNMADIGDRVSSKSTEYTIGINKLRGIADNISRQSSPQNRLKVEAARRLDNMVQIYRAEEVRYPDFKRELGTIKETMRTMNPENLQSYLDQLERLWKVAGQEIQIEKQAQDRLLGVGKGK